MSKTNLCIIGLSKQFTDNVCKQLANKMEMFYANIEEIFAYDLMDVGRIEEVCGVDYLFKEEKSIIRRVCGYDNTLINIDYALLNNDDILNHIKTKCLLVYLSLDRKRFIQEQKKEMISSNLISINNEVFDDRNFLCNRISDIKIDCDELDDDSIVNRTIETILNYYS